MAVSRPDADRCSRISRVDAVRENGNPSSDRALIKSAAQRPGLSTAEAGEVSLPDLLMIRRRRPVIVSGSNIIGGSGHCYRVGNDGVGLYFRMGRAEAHLAVRREATKPTR